MPGLLAVLLVAVTLAAAAAAKTCKPCTCGVARAGRVVGGEAIARGEFPWLAAVARDGIVICGATVVARDHLVTATHCVEGIDVARLSALVGEYELNGTLPGGRAVLSVAQHPDYNSYSYDNDIAVLRLEKPLPSHLFRPACLPDMSEPLEGREAIVSGWGSTIEKGPPSTIPMKAHVEIWPADVCEDAGYARRKVTPRMLCASAPNRDSCKGDSGGPLLLPGPHYTLIGIVSWGRGCARDGYPGVYARVDTLMPWLRLALRNACLCSPPEGFYRDIMTSD